MPVIHGTGHWGNTKKDVTQSACQGIYKRQIHCVLDYKIFTSLFHHAAKSVLLQHLQSASAQNVPQSLLVLLFPDVYLFVF